jgi:hypothetical protein
LQKARVEVPISDRRVVVHTYGIPRSDSMDAFVEHYHGAVVREHLVIAPVLKQAQIVLNPATVAAVSTCLDDTADKRRVNCRWDWNSVVQGKRKAAIIVPRAGEDCERISYYGCGGSGCRICVPRCAAFGQL